MKLSVDFLKANSERLYYFGLGFIQVKLTFSDRVHFYSPNLPAITENPHNHRYDFTSTILHGKLKQTLFSVVTDLNRLEQYTHFIIPETCAKGVTPDKVTETPCRVMPFMEYIYSKGDRYVISHTDFHTVEPQGECITFLTRSVYKKDLADVIYKIDEEKICPFSKEIPENELWEIIADMLTRYEE